MNRVLPGALLVCGALAFGPDAAAAQDPPPPTPPAPPQDTELVFEREVFAYPPFARVNPFRPLLAADAGGPRYEQLRLMGIIYSRTPGNSVAVLSTSGLIVNEDGTLSATEGDTFNRKVGQTVGNVTVIEITLESVVVDVEEFGVIDRRIMRPLNLLGGNQ